MLGLSISYQRLMLRSSKTYLRFLRCLARLLVTRDVSDAWVVHKVSEIFLMLGSSISYQRFL